ncbi:MAG: CDP-alcohol phosphatidyltransferase family protein [Candidatus Binatia bacterium]
MINLPNTLTLMRILAVPAFLSMLTEGRYQLALIIFMAAGATDALDGAIARLTDTRTELGAHLDPLADKLLLLSSFIALGILGEIPLRLMIMVIVRDVVILGGFSLSALLVGRSMPMSPTLPGKLTTFAQLVTVSAVMLVLAEWIKPPPGFLTITFITTGLLTLFSGIDYVRLGLTWYQKSGAAEQ